MQPVFHILVQTPGRPTKKYILPERFSAGSTSYEIKEWAGDGGNSAVFKVHAYSNGSFVGQRALKVLKQLDPVRIDRFRNEVRILENLSHDRIAKFYGEGVVIGKPSVEREGDGEWSDVGEPLELQWLAMDLGGHNLRRHIEPNLSKQTPLLDLLTHRTRPLGRMYKKRSDGFRPELWVFGPNHCCNASCSRCRSTRFARRNKRLNNWHEIRRQQRQ